MADAQKVAELEALSKDPSLSEEVRGQVLDKLEQLKNEHLQGWVDAGPKLDEPAPVPGALGLQRVIGYGDTPPPAAAEPGLESKLDPRFDLMPQALAVQPATTHPGGDQAAKDEWEVNGGKDTDAVYVYEPPVALVKKRLVEDPAFARVIRPDVPPTLEELNALDSGSSLYRDAANYMWRRTAEAGAEAGKHLVRYSQAPWLQGRPSTLDSLKLKLGGIGQPVAEGAQAFVMGADDTALFGAGRAAQETLQPNTTANPVGGDTMGLKEGVPQDTKELNQWNMEEHPIAYGAGQALGLLTPWSASNRLFKAVAEAGQAGLEAAKITNKVAPVLTSAVAGGVGAAGTQAAQEGVDLGAETLQSGQLPTGDRLAEAGERIKDTGLVGAGAGAFGSVVQQGAAAGADAMRWTGERFGGLLGAAEPHIDFGVRGVVTGPRLQPETKREIIEARKAGKNPVGASAQRLAPPIAAAADAAVRKEIEAAGKADEAFYQTPEGKQLLPLDNLVDTSIDRLRAKYQPEPNGRLRQVADPSAAREVLNGNLASVSIRPVQGARELSPEEAQSFLGDGRKAQLQRQLRGGKPLPPGQTQPPLAKALKRAGIDRVYVVPARVDARRHEALVSDLQGPENTPRGEEMAALQKAALTDRDARSFNGERGGWSKVKQTHNEKIGTAKKTERAVAPGGDAFRPVVRHGRPTAADAEDVDRLRSLAADAGVSEQLEKHRALEAATELQNRAWYRGAHGEGRGLFNVQNNIDAAQLRAFPVLRALESPIGPVGGGLAGRAAVMGQQEDDRARLRQGEGARAQYERDRKARLDALRKKQK